MRCKPTFAFSLKHWAIMFVLFILVPTIGAQYILNYKYLRSINEKYTNKSLADLSQYIESAIRFPMVTEDEIETKRIADSISSRPEVFAVEVRNELGSLLYRAENAKFSLSEGLPILKKEIAIRDYRDALFTDAIDAKKHDQPSVYGNVMLYITPEILNKDFEQELYTRSALFIGILLLIATLIYIVSDYNRKQVRKILNIMKNIDHNEIDIAGCKSVILEFSEISNGLSHLSTRIHTTMKALQRSKAEAETATLVAEQASQVKAEFIHNMSHEIRTPTNTITNLITLLEKQAKASQTNVLFLQHVSVCKNAASELQDVVEELVDFEKMEAGYITANPSPVDISAFFSTYSFAYTTKFESKDISFRVIKSEDSVPVDQILIAIDGKKVHRILVNILENALKYTKNGSVTLTWKITQIDKITYLETQVSDTGIGISDEDIDRIFDSFFQTANAKESRKGGSGIGLSIAKKMVGALGGEITVISKLDIGTTFNFSFPVEIIDRIVENNDRETPVPITFSLSAVIIDDNQNNCYTLDQLLKEYGVRSCLFTDPNGAIDFIKENTVDIIFADYHMPSIDGVELIKNIHALQLNSDATVICVTADTHPNIRKLMAAEFVDDLLLKPINSQDLYKIVCNVQKAKEVTTTLISSYESSGGGKI